MRYRLREIFNSIKASSWVVEEKTLFGWVRTGPPVAGYGGKYWPVGYQTAKERCEKLIKNDAAAANRAAKKIFVSKILYPPLPDNPDQ